MASIKIHLVSHEDTGTVSCDYRGQGDKSDKLSGNRKTLLEKEFGPDVETNETIEKVILLGPAVNQLFASMGGAVLGLGLRIGVFDH